MFKKILIATDLNDVSSEDLIETILPDSSLQEMMEEIDDVTYGGSQVYFAFHHNADDMYGLHIDNIAVRGTVASSTVSGDNDADTITVQIV